MDRWHAGSLTSPAVLAKAMRSRLGDQTRKMISCGSCFSPTTRKDGKHVAKRNMGAALQGHPTRKAAGTPSAAALVPVAPRSPALPSEPQMRRYPRDAPPQARQPLPPSLPPRASRAPQLPRRPARALRALPGPGLPRESSRAVSSRWSHFDGLQYSGAQSWLLNRITSVLLLLFF